MRRFGTLVAAWIAVALFAIPSSAVAAEDDPAAAVALLTMVNNERLAAGLVPVVMRDDVSGIAVAHSRAMADAGGLWHNDSYFTKDTKARLRAARVGENVAKNIDLLDAHARLMASP